MKLHNDNKYQNFYNRLTFKGISVTLGTWVEGQPFFASLGQLGLATPKEYTNIFTLDDNQGVIAENYINDYEGIKNYSELGFSYSSKYSSENEIVFLK